MGLQHAGADHGETVEPDLRHEHDQQRGEHRRAAGAVGLGEGPPVQPGAGQAPPARPGSAPAASR